MDTSTGRISTRLVVYSIKQLIYKNIIFLFLLFPEMYEIVERESQRESKTPEIYTQGEIQILSEPLHHRSAFTRLLRAISRHRIILDSLRFSPFAGLVQMKFFSTSQLWAVWHKFSAQSDVMSSSSSLGLFRSPRSKSPLVYIFRTPMQSSWSHLLLTRCT